MEQINLFQAVICVEKNWQLQDRDISSCCNLYLKFCAIKC